ncbi:calcineurin-like phosphoesterase C-terminal domain-containing protein [Pseudomarimonas salicorniae]|uniref:Calcineurin-like phosphoesterase family protein n=1 Tax=Pseudomarimonas salicorniae TaxID=2933270 RepID=A0ABT0GLV9_9GAMM|nr:calcineurin-like phosphoesterase family protein [Lysobacter sp. CAU 1642]MCK7595408.1 calcineurin-like phosphoesterase family protein [Lysobacter sp. CAU 1642]
MSRISAACVLLLLLCAGGPATAGTATRVLEGRVLADRDGDGRADRPREGIGGVALSNGRELVRSGPDGRYRITLRDGDTLLLIKPADWQPALRADGLPDIWQHERRKASRGLRYGGLPRSRASGTFVLRPAPAVHDPFEIRVFGDPQPKSALEVEHFRRDIVEPLIGRPARLGITLGDIVDDDLSLYPSMLAAMRRLDTPWLHVPGNHDLDFDAATDAGSLETFRAHFGPDTLAWEEPGVSVIGLDDVIYDPESRRYAGGLREDQLAFLEAYLGALPADRLVVLAVHIPLFGSFDAADRQRLFALLRRFDKVLVLSAHSHTQRHVFYGEAEGWHGAEPLHEYNVGATCGGYWGGLPDAEGVPDARMADGTPNGYATLMVEPGGDYRLRWTAARDADDPAMHLHAPKVLRRGAYPGVPVVANVYMADSDSRVEARIGDGPWQPMRRVEAADPVMLAINLADDAAGELRSFNRLPQAVDSTHLFMLNLPTDLELGEHRIEVRVFDRWRGELRAETRYRIADWP